MALSYNNILLPNQTYGRIDDKCVASNPLIRKLNIENLFRFVIAWTKRSVLDLIQFHYSLPLFSVRQEIMKRAEDMAKYSMYLMVLGTNSPRGLCEGDYQIRTGQLLQQRNNLIKKIILRSSNYFFLRNSRAEFFFQIQIDFFPHWKYEYF